MGDSTFLRGTSSATLGRQFVLPWRRTGGVLQPHHSAFDLSLRISGHAGGEHNSDLRGAPGLHLLGKFGNWSFIKRSTLGESFGLGDYCFWVA